MLTPPFGSGVGVDERIKYYVPVIKGEDEIIMKAPDHNMSEVYCNRGKRYRVGEDGLIRGVEPCDVATLQTSGFHVVTLDSDEWL